MKTTEYKQGDIFQFSPDNPNFPGQFIVASEIKDWGIQGYLLLAYPDAGTLVRFKGMAYLRPKYEEIVKVGQVEWFFTPGEDNE